MPEFWITQLNYIGLYTLVVLGLVLLTGVAGLTSFGQAAFVGLGAYTTAYLTLSYGVSPWLTRLDRPGAHRRGARSCSAWVTLRMSGHYLPLATIAWGLSLFYLLGNLEFLGKYDGLLGIPALSFFGIDAQHRARVLLPAAGSSSCWRAIARHAPARLARRPRDPRAQGRHDDGRGDGRRHLPRTRSRCS